MMFLLLLLLPLPTPPSILTRAADIPSGGDVRFGGGEGLGKSPMSSEYLYSILHTSHLDYVHLGKIKELVCFYPLSPTTLLVPNLLPKHFISSQFYI